MKKRVCFILLIFSLYSLFSKTRTEIVQELFRSVERWMGTNYQYGGTSKGGVDCSAFVQQVYSEVFNVQLPRSVNAQKNLGTPVTDKLEPGDLLFFNINGSISHVGIYVFDNKFIHAASSGPDLGVIKSSLDEKYYKERFAFARRLVTLPPYTGEIKEEKKIVKNQEIEQTNNKIEAREKKQDTDNRSISKKEEPQQKSIISKAELVFGKKFIDGKIYHKSSFFEKDSKIYLMVRFPVNIKENTKILFFNEKDVLVKEKEINKTDEELFYILSLKQGKYTVRLITKENDILDEKMIFVD